MVSPNTEVEVPAVTAPQELAMPDEDPLSSTSGSYLSSYIAHNTGDIKNAIRYLEKVLAKDPNNPNIIGQLLVLRIIHGEVDEAAKLAKRLSTKPDRELIVDLLLAIKEVRGKNYSGAKEILANANSQSFDHIWLPLLRAWLDSSATNTAPVTATQLLGETKEVPSFIYYHLGLLNDFRGHTKEAEAQYVQAITDKERAPFRALLAYIQLKARQNDREPIQQLMIDLRDSRPEMVELLEEELPYLKSLADAELTKTQLVNGVNEGVSEVLLTMASMLYMLDAGRDTALYLRLAIYLKPDFPTAQLMLATTLESFEHWQQALGVYEEIRNTSPLYLKAGIRRAYILEKIEKPTQALNVLDLLIAKYPNLTEPLIAKGDFYRSQNDYEMALQWYDRAITIAGEPKPEHWNLYFARGASYEQLKDSDSAIADLKYALELSPEQPEVLNYLGYMLLTEDKEIENAVEMIKKAYTLSPNAAHIIDSMGWAFLKIGKVQEAIAMLEKAAEMMPNDATINEHLGDAYWHAGRKIEARYQWKRAIDFLEDESLATNIRLKIDKGLTITSYYTLPGNSNTVTQ